MFQMISAGVLIAGIAIATVWLLSWCIREYKRCVRLPPGPWGLPIVGVLPWLDPVNPHHTLTDFATRYGSVYSAQLGGVLAIVASDPAVVRTALSRHELSGRAPLYLTHGLMEGKGKLLLPALVQGSAPCVPPFERSETYEALAQVQLTKPKPETAYQR